MSTLINPTGGPNDPRIGAEQTSSQGTRRRPDSDPAKHGSDAAKVTISNQAAAVSQTLRLAHSENAAAARGSVADISRASELVKALAKQIAEQPAAAHAAQARISPKSALNLLS
jgi:hypothetical protein